VLTMRRMRMRAQTQMIMRRPLALFYAERLGVPCSFSPRLFPFQQL